MLINRIMNKNKCLITVVVNLFFKKERLFPYSMGDIGQNNIVTGKALSHIYLHKVDFA